ncbi:hypothetical protein IscW_ISCW002736 [Ixodes scapularis]|uniref:Uncharacterized protein n=1 Tax=Ixodes scapularis TaxID=6945 RepID=B7PBY2_IXOSC|nr:hypothetical protein IscW_ISCW002736 [Ixodes scapularis]|eukprot:XP_002409061.1 hypothetical protein IscW_ISCW002736 [Ixodes scapularis]
MSLCNLPEDGFLARVRGPAGGCPRAAPAAPSRGFRGHALRGQPSGDPIWPEMGKGLARGRRSHFSHCQMTWPAGKPRQFIF